MPDTERLNSTEPPLLDYALPSQQRDRPPLLRASIRTILVGAALFVGGAAAGPYVGSGIMRPNPLNILLVIGGWFAGIVYVWQRLAGDDRSDAAIFWIGWCSTAALICFPIQGILWMNDPSHPQSRFRAGQLIPLYIGALSLAGAVLGFGICALRRRYCPSHNARPGVSSFRSEPPRRRY